MKVEIAPFFKRKNYQERDYAGFLGSNKVTSY